MASDPFSHPEETHEVYVTAARAVETDLGDIAGAAKWWAKALWPLLKPSDREVARIRGLPAEMEDWDWDLDSEDDEDDEEWIFWNPESATLAFTVCEIRCRLAAALSCQGLFDAALAHAEAAVDVAKGRKKTRHPDFGLAAALACVKARRLSTRCPPVTRRRSQGCHSRSRSLRARRCGRRRTHAGVRHAEQQELAQLLLHRRRRR